MSAPHTEAGGLADVLAEQYVAHRLYHSEAGTIAGPDWFAEDFAGRAEPALRAYLTARLTDDDVVEAAARALRPDIEHLKSPANIEHLLSIERPNARAALSAAAALIGGGER